MATFNETVSGGILLGGTPNIFGIETRSATGGVLIQGAFSRSYTYEGSGGVEVFNCARVGSAYFVSTRYGPGDIAFSISAAKKGILEKVCIKTVALNCTRRACARSGAGCFPLYRDKYNSVWLDENLVTQANAIILAQAYIDKVKGYEDALVRNC
jgi:hypothetical protein